GRLSCSAWTIIRVGTSTPLNSLHSTTSFVSLMYRMCWASRRGANFLKEYSAGLGTQKPTTCASSRRRDGPSSLCTVSHTHLDLFEVTRPKSRSTAREN